METEIETVLFDLDGTLVDTEPSAARAVTEIFSEWGMALKTEDAEFMTGRTWESAVEYLFQRYPVPRPPEEATRIMIERYREILAQELIVIPGAAEAVRELAGHFKLALVSGSRRAEIFWALDRLGVQGHFQAILGAEDYPRSKPAPDGYAKALTLLGTEPVRGLVFEDSVPGIQSALDAGLWVVGVGEPGMRAAAPRAAEQDAHERIPDLRCVTRDWVLEFSRRTMNSRSR